MAIKTFNDFNINVPSGAVGNIKTTCPQCSATRKKANDKCLSVNVPEGVWNCHHCGYSGTLKEGRKDNPPKAYARPKYQPAIRLPEKVVKWFKDRGITENILQQEKIGYGQSFANKGGIQFPYYKGGEAVNIKHRASDKTFRQEKNAEKCLYRFDAISEATNEDTLIITEGEIDALSFLEAGFSAVTSIPDGAPSSVSKNYATKFNFLLSAEEILKRYKKIVLAMDNDSPGVVAEKELARRIGVEKCWRVEYPDGCKDANDVLVKHGEFAVIDMIDKAKPYPVEGLLYPYDLKNDVLTLYDNGAERGFSTGWQHCDKCYTVKPGEITVLTGIPGHGKSNLVDALMINLMELHQWSFAVFSPENWPPERHLQTLLEKLVQKPFDRDGQTISRMTKEEVKYNLSKLDRHFSFIMPKEELLTVDTILEKARVAIFRHGAQGLVIDPWNEVEHLFNGLTETQYISRELSKIRRFARFNGVHIWIVAHPRNLTKDEKGNYKPPTMYEISGGANWRNKADNGLCVHRPDFGKDETVLYIQKIRFKEVGRVGKVGFRYCRETGTYQDTYQEAVS